MAQRCRVYHFATEGRKQCAAIRVLPKPPFGMPLNAQGEPGHVRCPHRFDLTVLSDRFDRKPVSNPIDPLPVDRVDRRFDFAKQSGKGAVYGKHHAMGGTVLNVNGLAFIGAVIEAVVMLMHVLDQGPATRDVQFLNATTDEQSRDPSFKRPTDQRQVRCISPGVMMGTVPTWRAIIVVRLDVRRAARDQEPVEVVQQVVDIMPVAQSGDQKGKRAGPLGNGTNVLVPNNMERVGPNRTIATRDTNDGSHEIFLMLRVERS